MKIGYFTTASVVNCVVFKMAIHISIHSFSDFRKKFTAKPFKNVNVYQIVCHVTGIKARPNNGTWSDVKEMLVDRHSEL